MARVSSHYGVCLEFHPEGVNLGIHLDKVAKRCRGRDLFHSDKTEAIRCLRRSYSVITGPITFLQNLSWSTLRGPNVQVERVRDTLLSLMEHRSDIHSGRISPKLPDDSEEWMGTPLMNRGEIR